MGRFWLYIIVQHQFLPVPKWTPILGTAPIPNFRTESIMRQGALGACAQGISQKNIKPQTKSFTYSRAKYASTNLHNSKEFTESRNLEDVPYIIPRRDPCNSLYLGSPKVSPLLDAPEARRANNDLCKLARIPCVFGGFLDLPNTNKNDPFLQIRNVKVIMGIWEVLVAPKPGEPTRLLQHHLCRLRVAAHARGGPRTPPTGFVLA